MTSPRKPTAGFWSTVAVNVVLVAYPLSFGPACWWFADSELDGGVVVNTAPTVYWPIGWLAENGPEPLSRAINWYGTLRIYWVHVPVNRASNMWIALVQKNS
jgi:hypothetical protein